MPKTPFFNLPEEKREKILDVLKEEFINKPYNEITIRSITKKAGISLGSFNYYFENKDDAYKFIYFSIEEELYKHIPEEYNNDFLSDIALNYMKEFDYIKYISQKEIDFILMMHEMPRKVYLDICQKHREQLENGYKREIINLINDGKINSNINVDFTTYIWSTLNTNIAMHYHHHINSNNINSIKNCDKIYVTFIEKLLLQE